MNAYRNYNNNTSAIGKNLEKLSSGYKINRAGDDAAGLAVSQKMRLQIAGLAQAQKNAKSGISLVQTAEGSLQEVHEMLERMYTIAEQSANGTYDKDTDRTQLQKELNQLRTEIERIGKTANFNGIGLFAEYDGGSSSGAGSAGGASKVLVDAVLGSKVGTELADAGTKAAQVITATIGSQVAAKDIDPNQQLKYQISVKMGNGDTYNYDITFDAPNSRFMMNGTAIDGATTAATNVITADEFATLISKTLGQEEAIKAEFGDVAVAGSVLTFTNQTEGFESNSIESINISGAGLKDTAINQVKTTTKGTGEYQTLDAAQIAIFSATANKDDDPNDFVFTIGGKKFALAQDAAAAAKFGTDVNVYQTSKALDKTTVGGLVALINQQTGLDLKATDGAATIELYSQSAAIQANQGKFSAAGGSSGGGSGASDIWFAIGAEANDNNKLTLGTMHLGPSGIYLDTEDAAVSQVDISKLDISDQQGGWDALEVIKSATNAVSDMRGTLGATQNRLDHTIKNLSVMQENMQDAESVIRDTDVAEEMMAYTKNNILVQSAQAMLAQANQLPQGVLQLLG